MAKSLTKNFSCFHTKRVMCTLSQNEYYGNTIKNLRIPQNESKSEQEWMKLNLLYLQLSPWWLTPPGCRWEGPAWCSDLLGILRGFAAENQKYFNKRMRPYSWWYKWQWWYQGNNTERFMENLRNSMYNNMDEDDEDTASMTIAVSDNRVNDNRYIIKWCKIITICLKYRS